MLTRHIRSKRSRAINHLEELEPRVLLSAAAASAALHIVSASSSVVAAAALSAPAAPTLVSATTISPTSIQVNWLLNSSDESGEAVKRWSGSAWFTIAQLPAGSTSYVDTNLTPDTQYIYEVSAYNSVSETWAPNYVSATTSNLAVPAAPTDVSAQALSAGSVQVNWTLHDSSDTGVYVERWNGASWATIVTLPAGTESYVNSGLNADTAYYYDVVAFNAAGATWATNYASVTTTGGSPSAPTNLSATALSSTSIQVNWTLHGDDTSVMVERWNGSWVTIANLAGGTTTFTDTGLSPSTTYDYEVVAVNAVGSTWAATYTSAATQTGAAPAPATGLTASPINSTTIQVNWTLGDNTDTSVDVAKWNGSNWQIVAALAGGSTEYLDTFADPGVNYYEVIASNSFGSTWASFYTSAIL